MWVLVSIGAVLAVGVWQWYTNTPVGIHGNRPAPPPPAAGSELGPADFREAVASRVNPLLPLHLNIGKCGATPNDYTRTALWSEGWLGSTMPFGERLQAMRHIQPVRAWPDFARRVFCDMTQ